ncbi:MAG: TonB-dependent receptor, partial [Aliifodinibius sp.]|nr:TonB-dependent receptor [Fodinibius sp.]NIV10352.1 TonB-dependent receptor [Fodinibius sp.]NIY23991.1 TonB-dependent receptor [Fodinibius sp.]
MNPHHNLSKVLYSVVGILLFTAATTFAQTGQLEGTIINAEENSPLPGINVGVAGTTLGAATDTDGKFIIENIPVGSHTIKISAVGYEREERNITISEGETSSITVTLERDVLGINEVVVSATRSIESLDEVPASVNILREKELNDQLALSSDLNDMLAKQVPGFAQSTESASNWGQNLRGRDYLVLIDGIPQSTPLRAVSRDLQTIDAGAVSRVEVIKGATAIYGNGATGGLINYITALPQKDGFESISKVGSNISLSSPENSIGYRFSQQFMGRNDQLSYNFKGSFEEKGLYKDATGDIIPTNPQGQGGLSDASIYNLYGQVGYDINSQHHIEATYNFYSNDQETDYVTVPGSYPDQKATAQKGNVRGEPQGTRANHNARINYSWLDFIGNTSLDATAYIQDYETVFGYTTYYRDGGQSYLLSEKAGFRLNLDSPFTLSEDVEGSIVYGVDLLSDNTQQKLLDGRTFTPKMQMDSYAPYAQIKAIFYDNWVLKGGMRFEGINIDVPSYTTVERIDGQGGYQGGVNIEGGSLDYSAFTYNVGLSYKKFQAFNPYVSLSQGFSIADLGRTLRSATEPTTVQRIDPEPVIVQNYELGVNSSFDIFRGSISGFVSTSDLGSSYQVDNDGNFGIVRSPEIVYGVEVSANARPTSNLGLGATYSLTEGRSDNNNNGSYTDPVDEFLVNSRISPPKLTAYAEYQFTSKLNAKITMLHSGSRERFEPSNGSFAPYKNNVEAYTVFDLTSTYQLPFGSFSLGVQ